MLVEIELATAGTTAYICVGVVWDFFIEDIPEMAYNAAVFF